MRRHLVDYFRLLICAVLLAAPFSFAAAAGPLCYVNDNAGGANDGTSWTDAYTDLQSALADAGCTEIWVAIGTYKPTSGSDRTISFTLLNGVEIYGGFSGTETLRAQRDWVANATTLSGDLNADDVGFTNNGENSYHVVKSVGMNSTAVLDGFTISGGNANNDPADNDGGGMRNSGGSPTVTNLTFSGNAAIAAGGGMYNGVSSPILTNVTFSGNGALGGGGMANFNSSPALASVTFSGNLAALGGGMYNADSNPTLTNVTFGGNTGVEGGGMFNNNSSPTLTNVTFSGNTASNSGGGIYNTNDSSPAINDVILWGDGTEITDVSGSAPIIRDSVVEGGCPGGATCTNIITGNPNLGPLQDNGGYTQTMALGALSSAIDAGGVNSTCAGTDQRGVSRPQGAACDIGAFEVDNTAPIVVSTSLASSYTAPGPGSFTVTLNENVDNPAGDSDPDDVTNPANYLLVEDGPNGIFNTVSCAGGPVSDDIQIAVSSAGYNNGIFTATVTLAAALPAGSYRLFVCGTTSIVDLAQNPLNGGADYVFDFVVIAGDGGGGVSTLPATGFPQGRVTILPPQPVEKAYTSTDLVLEIPSLGKKLTIVGVPQMEGNWDVSWLGRNAGYLAGSAFPTWAGNSVLTGHVWDAYNQPGPFADLKTLKYGDQILIHAWGQVYAYEVRESRLVTSRNLNAVFQHEEYSWVTLLSCELFNPVGGNYLFRRMVRAVLVSVQAEQS